MPCAIAAGELRDKKRKFFFRVWLLAVPSGEVPSGEVPSGDMSWAKHFYLKEQQYL